TGCHLGTFIVAGGSRPDLRIKIKSYQQRSGPTLIKAAGPSVLGEVRNGFPELGFYKGKYLLGTGLSGDGFRIGDNGDGTEKVDQKKVKPGAKRSHFRNVLRLFTFFHPQLGIIQFLKVFQDHVALANALVRTNPASVNMAVLRRPLVSVQTDPIPAVVSVLSFLGPDKIIGRQFLKQPAVAVPPAPMTVFIRPGKGRDDRLFILIV